MPHLQEYYFRSTSCSILSTDLVALLKGGAAVSIIEVESLNKTFKIATRRAGRFGA